MSTFEWWARWFRSLPIFDPPVKRLDKTPEEIAREIDAILYSDLSCGEMVLRLKPFVAVGEHARLFVKRTGIHPRCEFFIGPYPTNYSVPGCGLELVMDDLYRIHILRRAARRLGDQEYPQQSLSEPIMRVDGYTREYHD